MAEDFLNSCYEGNLEGVKAALQSGVDVNIRDTNEGGHERDFAAGKTGLIWAVMKNHNSVVKLLLGTPGIDINAKDTKGDRLPFKRQCHTISATTTSTLRGLLSFSPAKTLK